ncbi:hypothetical protein HOK021_67750 [Streptomyces hygroscopicus]|nr:hypothetical protein HOK021_67750 [Streptomyces hygroscopicus]
MGAGHRRGRFQAIHKQHRTIHEHPHRPFPIPSTGGDAPQDEVRRSGTAPDSPAQRPGPPQAQRRDTTTAGRRKTWGAKQSAATPPAAGATASAPPRRDSHKRRKKAATRPNR